MGVKGGLLPKLKLCWNCKARATVNQKWIYQTETQIKKLSMKKAIDITNGKRGYINGKAEREKR